MPPEIVDIFKEWPVGLLLVFLASPFLVLIGVIITVITQRIRDRGNQSVAEANVNISETEAETHQFQVIFDGFSKSLEAVSKRADSAELKADKAELKADKAEAQANEAKVEAEKLEKRVKALETESQDAIDHIVLLEGLIPPPGPPERPFWMRHR